MRMNYEKVVSDDLVMFNIDRKVPNVKEMVLMQIKLKRERGN